MLVLALAGLAHGLVPQSIGSGPLGVRTTLIPLRHTAGPSRRARPPAACDYTSAERLREEVEAPFAKVRLFTWPVLFGAAGIATYFSATSLFAVAVGARPSSDSGLTDLAIDVGAMAVTGLLWRRELTVRDSRLRRIAFGARLAALRICQLTGASSADGQPLPPQPGPYASLADLRRGRGQSRRVIIVCAPAHEIRKSIEAAALLTRELLSSDFLVVPLITTYPSGAVASTVVPRLEAPPLSLIQQAAGAAVASATGASGGAAAAPAASPAGTVQTQPPLPWDEDAPNAAGSFPFALAQAPGMWSDALGAELEAANKQDASAQSRGLTIVLKKNGRVGTRRLGTPNWGNLVADVQQREQAGFDVANI
jgi:hypothetical protein